MKWSRLGDLMATGHEFFWLRETEETEAAGPGSLLSLEKNTTLCFSQLLSKDNIDRTTETSEYIVSLLLPWLCIILVDLAVHTHVLRLFVLSGC